VTGADSADPAGVSLGTPRLHLRRVDSTNERARAIAQNGAPHGALVTAAEQTAGRGRQGRVWVAPQGRALLMSLGIPYDSDKGRDYAGAISAVMCGQAYLTRARIAEAGGPCPGYPENEGSFLDVIRMDWNAVNSIDSKRVPVPMYRAAEECWRHAHELGSQTGFRNAQTTVLAPTGTIGFMMDCDTTGIEPDLALVKYKKLVGGGVIKIVNNTVPQALIKLGYTPEQTDQIVTHIDSTGTIEGAPHIKPEHLPVFDCSFRPQNGSRSIAHMGHVRMMGAVQPFISGAISKTINMPEDSTAEDIMQAYLQSWKLGLKAVAI